MHIHCFQHVRFLVCPQLPLYFLMVSFLFFFFFSFTSQRSLCFYFFPPFNFHICYLRTSNSFLLFFSLFFGFTHLVTQHIKPESFFFSLTAYTFLCRSMLTLPIITFRLAIFFFSLPSSFGQFLELTLSLRFTGMTLLFSLQHCLSSYSFISLPCWFPISRSNVLSNFRISTFAQPLTLPSPVSPSHGESWCSLVPCCPTCAHLDFWYTKIHPSK